MGRISKTELEAWKSAGRLCFVRQGKVFDVTDFGSLHPGGFDALKNNAGRDVTNLMSLDKPHRHSNNAYKLMDQYYVGEFESVSESNGKCHHTNGVSNGHTNGQANGHHNQTNGTATSPVIKDPIDYDKSVVWQILDMGEKYYEWTHVPISRNNMRLFHYDIFEYFSTSSWYAIPIAWIPFITVLCWLGIQQWVDVALFDGVLGGAYKVPLPCEVFPVVFALGVLLWTFLEYSLHRFLFHMEPPSTSKFLIAVHFVLHGQHHKVPFDPGRLVFPPIATFLFVVPYYLLLSPLMPAPMVYSLIAGTVFGYMCYDLIHYYLHHGAPAPGSYFQNLKTYHSRHHYEIQDKGFGISSTIWDKVFNTLIPSAKTD